MPIRPMPTLLPVCAERSLARRTCAERQDANKQDAATSTTKKSDRVGSQSLAPDAARQVKPVAESVRLPENSLAPGYIHKDSYMSRVPGRKATNQRALQVLARIESKLAGEWHRVPHLAVAEVAPGYEGSEQPLSVDEQVQTLIEEATNLENLCQGELFDLDLVSFAQYVRIHPRLDSALLIIGQRVYLLLNRTCEMPL